MKYFKILLCSIALISTQNLCNAQDLKNQYGAFRQSANDIYSSFQNDCNRKYIEFLRSAWDWYEGKAPLPLPKESPVPPKPYEDNKGDKDAPVVTVPIDVRPTVEPEPQPTPIEPIRENPIQNDYFNFDFYGINGSVRLPKEAKLTIDASSINSIANGWETLCTDDMNNAIRDCLEARIRYNLSDWAYLMFLDTLSSNYCQNRNGATLLTAFLYCQSGYQMRLAIDGQKLMLIYGSKHQIYDKPYFSIDGLNFYPLGEPSESIQICNAEFEGETPLSLLITREQLLGDKLSTPRSIKSRHYGEIEVTSQTPQALIDFFNSYPTSNLGNNPMTRWAMYANTPLAQKTKELIYPSLRNSIKDCTPEKAANKLLNWVQTGFEYEYDDKVWGGDRAFFAEESLYYPYCDCEDRSILFSRLVRDLLELDVALIYYPGHLATAVCFNEEVKGDAMLINRRKFIVCDPTYIGAPVGAQMPDLEYDKAQAIVLNR